MAGSSIVVSVLADTKPLAKGLDDGASRLEKFGKGFSNLGLGVAVGVAAVGVGVGKFVSDSIKAAGESQKVAAQTDAVVKSTGGAAGRTAEQIGDLALQLSNITGIDDEVVQGAENIIATFTQIKGEQFDATTKAALDMSVALGTDATSAAQMLGKALNDPVGGITKLTKAGVTFTDQQKDQIRAMTEAGDVAGAQSVILAEVAREFGGSAEAYGATFEGLQARASNAFGNIKEEIGTAFLPVLSQALESIAGYLQRVGDSDRFREVTSNIADFVGTLVDGAPDVADFIGSAVDFAKNFSPVVTLFEVLEPYLPDVVQGLKDMGGVLGGELGDAVDTLAPLLSDIAGTIKDDLKQAVEDNLPALDELGGNLGDIATTLIEDGIPAFVDIVAAIAPLLPQLVELGTDSLPAILFILNLLLGPTGEQTNGFNDMAGAVGGLVGGISFLIGLLPGVFPLFSELISLLDGSQSEAQFVKKVLEGDLGPVLQVAGRNALNFGTTVSGAFRDVRNNVSTAVGNVRSRVEEVFNSLPQPVQNAFNRIGSAASGGISGVVATVGGLPGRIVGAVGDLGNILFNAGAQSVAGLIRGVESRIGGVGSIAREIGRRLLAGVENALGIASPSKRMAERGVFTVDGLILGARSRFGALGQMTREMAGVLLSGVPTMTDTATLAGDAFAGSRSGMTVYIDASMLNPTVENGRVIAEALDDYRRAGGNR